MHYTPTDLQHIANQARPLAERLQCAQPAAPGPPPGPPAQARLARWQSLVAEGDAAAWQRYLAWAGLDEQALPQALGDCAAADGPLPTWVATLAEALALTTPAAPPAPFLRAEAPVPFEELLAPFVQVARQRIVRQAAAGYRLLSADAASELDRRLLIALAQLAAQTFGLEFGLFRASRRSLRRWLAAPEQPGREQYLAFVAHLQAGALLPLFREYCVLARLLAITVDHWATAIAELLSRLADDWAAIEQEFPAGAALGQVVRIQAALSDPHNHGRMVCCLEFANGRRLVYKPKDVGPEHAFGALLAWCNRRGVALPLRPLHVLRRAGYGWVEHAAQAPCADQAAAARFYRRGGMLLCLMYVLHGTDCHYENLIASGDQPVLIDMETLFHPRPRAPAGGDAAEDAATLAGRRLWESVLATGLLPSWEFGPDGSWAYDSSGLGGVGRQHVTHRWPEWQQINTDAMVFALRDARVPQHENTAMLDGAPLAPQDYLADLIDGFRTMYGFLAEQRSALLAPAGPLAELAQHAMRHIMRPTKAYGVLLRQTQLPRLLRHGADRSIEFAWLCRGVAASPAPPIEWPLLAAEQAALERLDVPFFLIQANSTALYTDAGQCVPGFFGQAGYARVQERIAGLSPADLAQQVALIRSAFDARMAQGAQAGTSQAGGGGRPAAVGMTGNGQHLPHAGQAHAALTQAALLERARGIAEELRARAIVAPDGSCAWIGMQYTGTTSSFQLQPLGDDWYNGASGIALFLAMLDALDAGAGYRDLALGALQPLHRLLGEPQAAQQRRLARQLGLGGAAGLGSLVYVLTRISRLLSEPALLADAQATAALITPERIAADQELDVIGGAAGAILGLLALYEATADPALLEQAGQCARHLLDRREPSPQGPRTWRTGAGQLLTGFGHGAAGIAYALLRLAAITGDQALLDAAGEAIGYEQQVFVPEAGNWPDYRHDAGGEAGPVCAVAWCAGATGIGLARLGGLALLDTPAIRADIEAALAATLSAGVAVADHLCCGSCGRIELLLAAAERLGRPELRAAAEQRMAQVLAASERDGLQLFHNLPRGVYNPGFFQGAAGVGYELLRLAYPAQVPSALLFE